MNAKVLLGVSGIFVVLLLISCTPKSGPVDTLPTDAIWYVSPTGDDSHDCHTLNTPCQHISVALERAEENQIIRLAEGTYTENLVISKSLTISGAGRDVTIVRGVENAESSVIRIGTPDDGSQPVPGSSTLAVTLSGFSIQEGDALNIYKSVSGGGIFIKDGTLVLEHMEFFRNSARLGGAIYIRPDCHVTASDVYIRGNESVGTDGDNHGGGIFNFGTLIMTDSTIEMNVTELYGGGLYNSGGEVNLTNVHFIHNIASRLGGGIFNEYGSINLLDTDFDTNQATYGGGIFNLAGTVLVQRGDFVANLASNSGGAIANVSAGDLTLVNVTIGGNEADSSGGGLANGTSQEFLDYLKAGPGQPTPQLEAAILNAYNLTIAYNQASGNLGGGVINLANGDAAFTNTIFTDNTGENCAGPISGDGNLDTDSSCAFHGSGNLYGFDPLLDPSLALNGGLTHSYALQTGSPAIDTGIDGPAPIPDEDQRGNPRPTDGDGYGGPRIDIGAYETDGVTNLGAGPVFVPIIDAFCHQYPGETSEVANSGVAGTGYPIQGISQDGQWFYILLYEGRSCWMGSGTGIPRGDQEGIPVIETLPEGPCTDNASYAACVSHSECKWTPLGDIWGFCGPK